MDRIPSIDLSVLPKWSKLAKKGIGETENEVKGTRFPIRSDINDKIILWQGDLRLLAVDAVVNSTNESMSDDTGISGSILEAAGSNDILEETGKSEPCRTGEARITGAFCLPARWVIHTVAPRFNDKYKIAAENALHSCYRNCFEILKEYNLRTVAFPVISNQKRGFPAESACHVAVRTIRRFLEHWGKDIDLVILCVSHSFDFDLYSRILPLYCPRNNAELLTSKEELPRDVGNAFGETEIEERKIRISAFPGCAAVGPPLVNEVVTEFKTQESVVSETPLGQFVMMKEGFDEERKKRIDNVSKEEKQKFLQQQIYLNHLYKAQTMDLSDVARLNLIYESGKDSHGRPILVIVGNRLPTLRSHLNRVFLYMIKIMDRMVNYPYVVVYVHTNMEEKATPELSWMKEVYNLMDNKYGDHLNVLYVIHPSFWLKIVEGFLSSFMANDSFFKKVRLIEKVDDIYETIEHEQLILPDHVFQYDSKVNGTRPQIQAKRNFAAEDIVNDL